MKNSQLPKVIGSALPLVVAMAVMPALATPSRAETRFTSFATFLHVGPGRQYAVSDEVPTRAAVEVLGCEKDWCQIRYGAAAGWIDQRMLASASQPASGKPVECFDFARTGWPNSGDHDRLCIQNPAPSSASPTTRTRP